MSKLQRARTAVVLCLAAVATCLVIAGGGGTAAAYPSQCGSAMAGNGATAWCNGGTGLIRAVAGCQNPFGWWKTAYAPWQNINRGASRVACDFGYFVKWSGFNLQ